MNERDVFVFEKGRLPGREAGDDSSTVVSRACPANICTLFPLLTLRRQQSFYVQDLYYLSSYHEIFTPTSC